MKHSTTLLKNKYTRILIPVVFWIAIWQTASAWIGMELLIPSPFSVLHCLLTLIKTNVFWKSVFYTLFRIFAGGFTGVISGILLAILTESFDLADILLAPVIRIIRTIPVASFIILILLWFHAESVPLIISALIVMPVIWENVAKGIRNTDPLMIEAGNAYQLSPWYMLRYIYYPSVRPQFEAALCTSIGLSWKSGVAAEVLCLPKPSVGTQIYFSKIYLDTPTLFAWTITVIVASICIEHFIRHRIGGIRT